MFLVLPLIALACGSTEKPAAKARNGLIAATTDRGIVLLAPNGSVKNRVPGTEDAVEVLWSPRGDELAFSTRYLELYVVRPDGSERTLVLRNTVEPAWSPDTKSFAVAKFECALSDDACRADPSNLDLYTAAADGSDLRKVVDAPDYQGNPTWSPDGEWIAFLGSNGLYQIRSDGSDQRLLAEKPGLFRETSWSPDGSKIAFVDFAKNPVNGMDIALVDVKTRKQTLLSRHGSEFGPTWSPDGKQIAFQASSRCLKTSTCTPYESWEIWVMDADGRNPHRITKGGFGRPSWAPASAPSED